jgi:hypothetical protein
MAICSVDRITISHGFDTWEVHHVAGLYDKKRCGRPPKLTEEEQDKAQHSVAQHPRDIKKVVDLLEQDTSKRVSTKTIKRPVKKTRVAKSAGVSSPQASRDMMLDHGESADEGSVADGRSPAPAAALARP